MNFLSPIGRRSLWELIRDPQVRTGIYVWLLIAGLCVIVANVMAASL